MWRRSDRARQGHDHRHDHHSDHFFFDFSSSFRRPRCNASFETGLNGSLVYLLACRADGLCRLHAPDALTTGRFDTSVAIVREEGREEAESTCACTREARKWNQHTRKWHGGRHVRHMVLYHCVSPCHSTQLNSRIYRDLSGPTRCSPYTYSIVKHRLNIYIVIHVQ